MSKKKQTIKPEELNGLSIYHEDKRTVYAPIFSKNGYLINENNVKHYISYIRGYLMAVLVFGISFIISKIIFIALVLSCLFMASTLVVFYRNFIQKTAVIENYRKPQRDDFINRQAASLQTANIITIIICSPLLSLAIMTNSYINSFKGGLFYLSIFIAAVFVFYGLLHVYILYIKKQKQL